MLLATAGNLEGIKQMIAKFYAYDSMPTVSECGAITSPGGKEITSTHVVKKGNRYRFEGK